MPQKDEEKGEHNVYQLDGWIQRVTKPKKKKVNKIHIQWLFASLLQKIEVTLPSLFLLSH